MNASKVIDDLGGTAEVARLCEVRPPSVSEWRRKGIPKARLQFLKLVRPDIFGAADVRASTPVVNPNPAQAEAA